MAGELSWGGAAESFGLQDLFSAAQTVGANSSFIIPRTSDTVTLNAIDGAVPIDNSERSAWGGFWRDTVKTIVTNRLAKDAAGDRVGVQAPRPAANAALPSWVLPMAVVGAGLVAVLLLKGK